MKNYLPLIIGMLLVTYFRGSALLAVSPRPSTAAAAFPDVHSLSVFWAR